jgi:hypothetical protein
MFKLPEKFRKHNSVNDEFATRGGGHFVVSSIKFKQQLNVVASVEEGWEHVSVSLGNRCPTWDEMCFVKGLFWDDEDVAIQFHPAKSEYVNFHPFALHLWRKEGTNDFVDKPEVYLL